MSSVSGVSPINHGATESFSGKISRILSRFQTAVFSIFEEMGRLFRSCFSFKRKPDATVIKLDREGAAKSAPHALKGISAKVDGVVKDASTPLSQSTRPDRPKVPAPAQKASQPKQSLEQSEKETNDVALPALKGITTFFGIGTYLLSLCTSEAPVLKPLLEPVINETAKKVISEVPEIVGEKVLEYSSVFGSIPIIESITCAAPEACVVIEAVAEEMAACSPAPAFALSDALMAGASELASRATALTAEMGGTGYAILGTVVAIGGLYAANAYRTKHAVVAEEDESLKFSKDLKDFGRKLSEHGGRLSECLVEAEEESEDDLTPIDPLTAIFTKTPESNRKIGLHLWKEFQADQSDLSLIGQALWRLNASGNRDKGYFNSIAKTVIKTPEHREALINYWKEMNEKSINFTSEGFVRPKNINSLIEKMAEKIKNLLEAEGLEVPLEIQTKLGAPQNKKVKSSNTKEIVKPEIPLLIAFLATTKERIEKEIPSFMKKFSKNSEHLEFNENNEDGIGPLLMRLQYVNDPYFYTFCNKIMEAKQGHQVINYIEGLNDKFLEFKKTADATERTSLLTFNFQVVTKAVIRNFEYLFRSKGLEFPTDLHIDQYEKKTVLPHPLREPEVLVRSIKVANAMPLDPEIAIFEESEEKVKNEASAIWKGFKESSPDSKCYREVAQTLFRLKAILEDKTMKEGNPIDRPRLTQTFNEISKWVMREEKARDGLIAYLREMKGKFHSFLSNLSLSDPDYQKNSKVSVKFGHTLGVLTGEFSTLYSLSRMQFPQDLRV